jgi:hypothetical protein
MKTPFEIVEHIEKNYKSDFCGKVFGRWKIVYIGQLFYSEIKALYNKYGNSTYFSFHFEDNYAYFVYEGIFFDIIIGN